MKQVCMGLKMPLETDLHTNDPRVRTPETSMTIAIEDLQEFVVSRQMTI
jgi:hypothetical protein